MRPSLYPFLLAALQLPFVSASFSCPAKDPLCLDSLLGNSNSSILTTFLGDHGTVIFQNGVLKNSTGCATMTVLFARGTAEPGNVGILTGPPFFAAIAAYMNGTGQLAIQGVDYPADVAGFLAGGSPFGGVVMAALVNSTLARCPNTLLTLSGYSQGAQIIHNSMSLLPATTTSKISSIVLFGDPKNGTAVPNVDAAKVYTICHAGDNICAGGDRVGIAHLNYSLDAGTAAGFVVNGQGMAKIGISSMRVKRVAGGGLG